MATGVRLAGEPKVIKERHLKFRFEQNGTEQEGIFFNAVEIELPRPPWDIAFTIDKNEFRGRASVNLVLSAIRKAE